MNYRRTTHLRTMGNQASATSHAHEAGASLVSATPDSDDRSPESRLPQYNGPPIGVAVLGTGQRGGGLIFKLLLVAGDAVKFVLYDEVPAALEEIRDFLTTTSRSKEPPVVADSVEAAVNHPDVQWVMVTSKNYLHKSYCVAALEAGKHVFCEKPLATTVEDCLAIREAARRADKILMTGFVLRYAKIYEKARSLVEEGFLGKIITMEANEMLSADHGGYIFRNWRRFKEQSGPHIMEKCAHDIDILNWMAGSIVTKVAAFGGNDIFTPSNKPAADKLQEESAAQKYSCPMYKGWSAWEDVDPFTTEKTVEDNTVAVLQYRNGIRATFQINCCSAIPQRQLKIFGIEGTLDSDSMQGRLVARRMARGAKLVQVDCEAGQHAGGDEKLVLELWTAMVHTAKQSQGGGESVAEFQVKASVEECFISTVTCLAIEEARMSGEVVNLEKYWEKLGL